MGTNIGTKSTDNRYQPAGRGERPSGGQGSYAAAPLAGSAMASAFAKLKR